jgi:putative spermidine/putrescine transport system substrate-binding protein
MKRNVLSAAVLLACAMTAGAASAQTPTLYLGSYGGSTEKLFKENIIPAFEAKHKVKIVYVAGNSTDTLAKLQAQKAAPELDVILVDDGPMFQAMQFGFCEKIADAPVYKDLYPFAKLGETATAVGVVATGLMYNPEAFKKLGLPAPDSWKILTDKKFAQKIIIPPISNTYGLQTLVKFAELNGGSAKNIDPGFEAIIKQVNPNVLAWEPSPGKTTELLQNGDAILGVWGSGRVLSLKETGFPIEFVYPKEGAAALMIAACPVVKSDVAELSQQFIQYLLQPEIQASLAASQGFGPVNRTAKLEPAVAAKVPYGEEQVGKLQASDWDTINVQRTEWTNRWNRTVER